MRCFRCGRESLCPPWCGVGLHGEATKTAVGAVLIGGDFGSDVTTVCSGCPTTGKFRATRFDENNEPFGHTEYESLKEAVNTELRWGGKLVRWVQPHHRPPFDGKSLK